MELVSYYSRNLAVTARPDPGDAQVLAGKRLFYAAGCTGCHTPKLATRRDMPQAALRGQLIWPYTDLLLHDMGDGIADNRPEGVADGREWRTAPLWGIGLTETVNGHTFFLHDGRARNLTEAILWHGGEAEATKERFREMPPSDRAALLAFLGRCEAAGTGPAAPGETPSTVYFWPDKHGTAGRQLAAALRARDDSLTRASDLANKSVGLQSGRATAGGAARRAQASARALGAGAGNGGGLQCPRRGLTR
jgi:hypothetical protein